MSSQSTQAPSSAVGIAWDLSALFRGPDDPNIAKSTVALQKRAAKFAKTYRGTLKGKPTAAHLLTALREIEAINEAATKIFAYAHLIFAADTSKDAHRQLVQSSDDASTALRNTVLFFDLEWLDVPEPHAKKLMADPKLAGYKHYLSSERKYKPHTLSEPEERVMNEKSQTGVAAWQKLHTEYMASLRYPIEVDGVVREVNQGEALVLMRSASRDTRRNAWNGFYNVLKANNQLLTFIYDTRFQDYLVNNRMRRYKSHAQPRHLANGIDGKAVDVMMTRGRPQSCAGAPLLGAQGKTARAGQA